MHLRFFVQKNMAVLVQLLQLTRNVIFDILLSSIIMLNRKKEREMKKVSKILCMLLVVAAIFCLHTVAFAEETTAPVYVNQILGPIGAAVDANGDLVIRGSETLELEADFLGNSQAIAWNVINGKDVLRLTPHPSNAGKVLATPLANGEAIVAAYLEDGSNQIFVTRKIVVSGQAEVTSANVVLNCSVEGNGNVERKTGADSSVMLGSAYKNEFPAGTEMDLTAVENTQPFKYWAAVDDTGMDVVISTEKNIKFILGTDRKIKAVFDKTDSGTVNGINATFIYEKLVADNTYVKNLAKDVPSAPYQRNMTFAGWVSDKVDAAAVVADRKLSKGEITEATTFTATYEKKEVTCEITVIGGSGSGTYAYGAPVSVSLTAEPDAGKVFLFWSKDGAPVSYEEDYAFSAMQDCTVCAVFGDANANVSDELIMVMQAPEEDGNVIAFTFERYVPEDYALVTSGFIVADSADCVRGDVNNLMDAVSHRAGERTQLTKSLKKVSGVNTYYARGYVVYMDGDNVVTVYTNAQKIVLE